MKKRVLSFIMTVNILFLFLSGRLFSIAITPENVWEQSSVSVKDLSAARGFIYDTNLLPLTNTGYNYVTCFKPSAEAMGILTKNNADKEYLEKLSKGYFLVLPSEARDIYPDCEDVKTFSVYNRYMDNSALHLIGYTDKSGNGVCGLEKYFNDYLIKTGGSLSIAYSADANGRMMTAESIEIRDEGYYNKDGIVLTIDKKIQTITETALKNSSIDNGAVIVLDAETSAILSCASLPTYDRNNLEESLKSHDSPFLNKAFTAYPVGSVFKVITAATAIENKIELNNYSCTGKIEKSKNVFNCNKAEGHGKLDLNRALSESCNPYFIELGTMTGGKELLYTAQSFAFGKSTDLGNGFLTDKGILPELSELNSDAAVGNFAFGQGKLTATPLQIAALFAAIGNDGIYNEPYLLKGYANENGALSPIIHTESIRVLKESTCKTLKKALLRTTTDGTGKTAFSSLFNACTKTATAQSGQYNPDGTEIKYCWFAGFFPYDNPQYVVCILKENGNSGGIDGGPVFKEISENIYINYLNS